MNKVIVDYPAPKIARLTLNDPEKLNAMSEEMADDFDAAVEALDGSKLRAIILTGSGRAFSAGGDLKMLEAKQKKEREANEQEMMVYYYSFLGILKLNLPIIAALNGSAIGAGLCVACACDIRIASSEAKLGFTFVKLGLHPGMGVTYTLPKLLGDARARELLLTGRVVEAPEAGRIGLVSEVLRSADVAPRALAIANEIAESGPQCVRQLTATLRGAPEALELGLKREAKCQGENYASAEFKEGLKAVMEKRKANF